ncbi:MAG: lipid A export permease/ATP-binding protein MsbA [Nitrospiraceae bacterium]|uniref:lipid A export permease/ATP-binding protein MsbA n=1 Tax=Nitrospira cf. moscoviensis SBR1015 TaxID=96242 RepID=UPI000A0E334A|nr:lipid A export permease/ATP-binding protein MsbA [Nitrospira cf. moscoviensis SBR1015]MBY0246121.1 lipid A export permease/ATP-binding protein MsbA [Nitrospiraceae bacterium]OQW32037.1 MAG: ABC transporter permease [Nitrospira sp. SG-bin2]
MSGIDRFKRLMRYVRPYRGRFIAAFACSGLVALLSAVYAWLVKPVLDGIFIEKNEELLLVLPLVLLGVALLKAVLSYGVGYLMAYVTNRVIADIRQELFQHLIRMPVGFHDTNTSGRLVSRVVNDVGLMASAASNVLKDIFQNALTFLAMVGVIVYQNWKLAGLSAIVIPLSALTMVRVGKRLRKLATSGQERMGDMSSTLQETLAGIRMVKAFGREEAEAERFKTYNGAFLATTLKSNQVWSIGSSHMEVIGVIGVAGIIWYGGYLVIHEVMTPGALFSFMAAMFMAYTPIRKLAGANNIIQQALAAAERVYDVMDLQTEQSKDRGTVALTGIRQGIEFQGVSLRYESQTAPALAGVDFSIKAGEVVALVGGSGGGKTTLVSLLPRFYEPTEGRILLDGLPLESYTVQSLRTHIGIVSQEIVLFDDTISRNIAFGQTGADQSSIEQAAKAAYAHEFILRLPEGYETIIGERGVKLSGGERQRLAIARAILRDPPLLILDEATSALDTESERIVQLALTNLMKNRTTVVIAHRLSTIQNADRIVVLDRGAIVETGSHEELLRKGGMYQRLHAMQFQDVTSV